MDALAREGSGSDRSPPPPVRDCLVRLADVQTQVSHLVTPGGFEPLPARPALGAGTATLPIEAADIAIGAAAAASESPGETLNWDLAERVAGRVAGREPLAASYLAQSLESDFDEMTQIAENLVADYTGLVSAAGPANAMVIDRRAWVGANVGTFKRMMRPLAERFGSIDEVSDGGATGAFARVARESARTVVSVEIGAVLGFLAQRVLGQYDLFLPEDGADAVYYVGPNILSLEKRFEFSPRDFRLWIALHELTHRAQFTGVPWMREYFVGLIEQTFAAADPDPRRLIEGARRAIDMLLKGEDPLAEGGISALLATPEQREVLQQVQALMCLLEGHGNVVMDRLGEEHIPQAGRMSDTLRARRATGGLQRFIFRLIGLEMKVQQYELGEKFVAEVESIAGGDAISAAWESVDALPTMPEIRDPRSWLERVA